MQSPAPARPSSRGARRLSGLLQIWTLAALVQPLSNFFLWRSSHQAPGAVRLTARRALNTGTAQEVLAPAAVEDTNYTEILLEKLPLLVGRQNASEALEFKVLSKDLGTELKLTLPKLAYWQYVRGKGRVLQQRPLPEFTASAETLRQAKEVASRQALEALFRRLRTKANSGNSRQLAQLIASMFAESVEVADIRYEAEQHASERSPGNLLYMLAYLSREKDSKKSGKRVMAVTSLSKISSFPWVHQALVQDKQRLVVPRNISVARVSSTTLPTDLAAYIEKELREKGAVTLKLKGTMAAQQAFLALARMDYVHRFAVYFSDEQDATVTELEVRVARRWRPIF